MIWRGVFDFHESCAQERFESFVIIAGQMVERRRNLDEALQKLLVGLMRFQPDGFPRFMRVKESAGIKKFDAV